MTRVERVDAADTRELRFAVLRPGRPAGTPVPGDVDGAVQLAARADDGQLVGAVALYRSPFPFAEDEAAVQLSSMAVAEEHRGSGIGAQLLAAAVTTAAELGGDVIWCNARTSARPFYERGGFRAVGDEFETAATGLPHFVMWRYTSEPIRPSDTSM